MTTKPECCEEAEVSYDYVEVFRRSVIHSRVKWPQCPKHKADLIVEATTGWKDGRDIRSQLICPVYKRSMPLF